jgi:hypothetical protein
MIVLRNGKEVGRAAVKLPDTDFQNPRVDADEDGLGRNALDHGRGSRWHGCGMSIDSSVIAQLKMPPGFAAQVKSAIQPGTTVLLTQAPLSTDTRKVADGARQQLNAKRLEPESEHAREKSKQAE